MQVEFFQNILSICNGKIDPEKPVRGVCVGRARTANWMIWNIFVTDLDAQMEFRLRTRMRMIFRQEWRDMKIQARRAECFRSVLLARRLRERHCRAQMFREECGLEENWRRLGAACFGEGLCIHDSHSSGNLPMLFCSTFCCQKSASSLVQCGVRN